MFLEKHKIIRRTWPAAALVVSITLLLFATAAAAAGATSAEVTTLTNAQRSANGLPALKTSPALNQAAVNKANYMFAKGYFDHFAPDGTSPWSFISATGYKYTIAAENLAKGCSTSSCVVNGWMGSAGHRSNILNSSITETGVGIVAGSFNGVNTTFVVAFYTKPAGEAAASAQTSTPPAPKAVSTPPPAPVPAAASPVEVKGAEQSVEEINKEIPAPTNAASETKPGVVVKSSIGGLNRELQSAVLKSLLFTLPLLAGWFAFRKFT